MEIKKSLLALFFMQKQPLFTFFYTYIIRQKLQINAKKGSFMDIQEVLERIAFPARSKKKGFKVTDKLEAIEALLKEEGSPYNFVHKAPQAWIFGKCEPQKSENPVLVSSHADIVSSITQPFSYYIEEEKYLKGTYDNLGTNAACVNLMLNEELPNDVYFAFTADEETGRCNGAAYALMYVRNKSKTEPTVFALDVTEEGYDNNRLFTVEGLHAKTEEKRREMLDLFMDTEGNEQSFEVVRLKEKDDDSFLPESYRAEDTVEYDESVFYASKNCNSCSICLPGAGYMHSDSGFYVKKAVMEGYCASLLSCVLAFTTKDRSKIDEIRTKKDSLVCEAKEIPFHKFYTRYASSLGNSGNNYSGGYYGDGLGTYWQRKMSGYSEQQIPGQMSLADIDAEFDDYYYDSDPHEELEFEFNDPFVIASCEADFYEFADAYDATEFDMFYSDILYTYGLRREDALEEYMLQIFAETHQEYEDDYYYE